MTDAAKSAEKQRGRPFKKGKSGNPAGRPHGSRNKATLAVEQLLEGEAEAITRKAIELALQGDGPALRLCMERLFPPRKDRPVYIDMPEINSPTDAVNAMGALVGELAEGNVTPSEAHAIAGVIETYRRTVETEEIERRLAALEVSSAR
ncbi:MAG: hypothetical protein ACI8S3_002059 [Alphaproteobacteria bacterium]|jgi:hypothetical protein